MVRKNNVERFTNTSISSDGWLVCVEENKYTTDKSNEDLRHTCGSGGFGSDLSIPCPACSTSAF